MGPGPFLLGPFDMRRREFITLVGGAAGAPGTLCWPTALGQQPRERLRRVGVLVSALPADDPEWQARGTAFVQGLQQLGWTDGRNTRLDFRFPIADPDRRGGERLIGVAHAADDFDFGINRRP